jgi:hypothetical protein
MENCRVHSSAYCLKLCSWLQQQNSVVKTENKWSTKSKLLATWFFAENEVALRLTDSQISPVNGAALLQQTNTGDMLQLCFLMF